MIIKKLIEEKKKEGKNADDFQKIKVIEGLIKDPNWALKLHANTVMGILKYLNVPDNKIEEYYFELISFKNYSDNYIKEYKIIDYDEENNMSR